MSHQRRRISPRVLVQMLVFVVLVPFLPLLISGHWDWWEAWAYALIGIFGFIISRALAARRHPDLLADRARFLQHEDAAPWDKLLAPLVGLGGALIPLVAGLAKGAHGSAGHRGSACRRKSWRWSPSWPATPWDPMPCSPTASSPAWCASRSSAAIT